LAEEKPVSPSTVLTFLGFEIDILGLTVSVLEGKLGQKLQKKTLRSLQTQIGSLSTPPAASIQGCVVPAFLWKL